MVTSYYVPLDSLVMRSDILTFCNCNVILGRATYDQFYYDVLDIMTFGNCNVILHVCTSTSCRFGYEVRYNYVIVTYYYLQLPQVSLIMTS